MKSAFFVTFALALAACAPKTPPGVDADRLEAAVSSAVGLGATCVLVGRADAAGPIWRHGSNVACGRTLPSCEGGTRTAQAALKLAAAGRDGALSCDADAPGRSLAWSFGPTPRPGYAYAAFVDSEAKNALPGREVRARLDAAFKQAGF